MVIPDLTNKEYDDFLKEVQADDDRSDELQDDSDDLADSNRVVPLHSRREQWLKDKRLNIIQINRTAFNQKILSLSKPIDEDNMKLLVELLTKVYTERINRIEQIINKRFTMLLIRFIPRALMKCAGLYPQAITKSPGFMYKASITYANGLHFWAQPNIPLFFKSGEEQQILVENCEKYLVAIDRHIRVYNENTNKSAKVTTFIMRTLLRKLDYTYLDLLKEKPEWFNILYNNLKNKENEQKNSTNNPTQSSYLSR